MINRAINLWRTGDAESAVKLLSRLLSRNASDPEIHGLLGSIYFQAEKYKNAYRHFALVSQLSPRSALAIRGMLHAALKLGWKNSAIKAAQTLATLTEEKDDIKLLKAIGG